MKISKSPLENQDMCKISSHMCFVRVSQLAISIAANSTNGFVFQLKILFVYLLHNTA